MYYKNHAAHIITQFNINTYFQQFFDIIVMLSNSADIIEVIQSIFQIIQLYFSRIIFNINTALTFNN